MRLQRDRALELPVADIVGGGAGHAEVDRARPRIAVTKPRIEPSDVVVAGAGGADAFHGAVAERDVDDLGRAVRRQHPDSGGPGPRARRGKHAERDQHGSHHLAASSSVRRYHGASGKVIGRMAGSVVPARRYAST
jgi:hypothetical protein